MTALLTGNRFRIARGDGIFPPLQGSAIVLEAFCTQLGLPEAFVGRVRIPRLIDDNNLCVTHDIRGVRKVADVQHGFVLPFDESKTPWAAGGVARI
jgi:hypothetical protein